MQDILLQLQAIVEKAGYTWWKPCRTNPDRSTTGELVWHDREFCWEDNEQERLLLFTASNNTCLKIGGRNAYFSEDQIVELEHSHVSLQDNLENFLELWIWLVGGDKEYQSLQMLHEKRMSEIGKM